MIREEGGLRGVEAVIDKDHASALLALELQADYLIIVTGVERVCLHFWKPEQREVDGLTIQEARQYLQEGQFPSGSMGPKIEACIRFIEGGGKHALITSIEKLNQALQGETGTVITR